MPLLSYCFSVLYGVIDTGIDRISMYRNRTLQIVLCKSKIYSLKLMSLTNYLSYLH